MKIIGPANHWLLWICFSWVRSTILSTTAWVSWYQHGCLWLVLQLESHKYVISHKYTCGYDSLWQTCTMLLWSESYKQAKGRIIQPPSWAQCFYIIPILLLLKPNGNFVISCYHNEVHFLRPLDKILHVCHCSSFDSKITLLWLIYSEHLVCP